MNNLPVVLKAMWTTMRPYLLFVSAITGIAGMAMTTTITPLLLIVVFVASFFAYGFGQALTDCFQTDTDAISAPYRPLVAGTVSRTPILTMSITGLFLCVLVFTAANSWNLALGALSGFGLATYTPFKRRWWGGPWYNAWIVAVLCFMAYLAASTGTSLRFPPSFFPMLGSVFFGYANFVLSGYFKDINADARTGYNTLPVVFGRRIASFASDGLAISFVVAATWTTLTALGGSSFRSGHLLALVFGVPGLYHVIAGQVLLHRNRDDADAFRPIQHVLQSYVLVLSALTVVLRPEWFAFIAAHYGLFTIVLARRPEAEQI